MTGPDPRKIAQLERLWVFRRGLPLDEREHPLLHRVAPMLWLNDEAPRSIAASSKSTW
jgi:hypothetical protein